MESDSANKLTLTYFRVRGRAELTRLVFAAGAVPYEDERISREEVARRKETGLLPFGQVPVLTVNGKQFAQSYSIAKFAAKLAGLTPFDPLDALAVESIVDSTDDVRTKFVPIRYMPVSQEDRLKKYTEFFDKTLPPWLRNFERLFDQAAESGFLVGNTLTVADLAVFNMCSWLTSPSCEVQAASLEHTAMGENCLQEFPRLKAHKGMVAAVPRIAAWLAMRPQHPHDNVVTLTESDFS